MPPLHSARRLALHSARSLTASIPTAGLILSVALTASVASAQTYPVGGRPSPRFGAQPFTQQLLLAEEFGTRPLPPAGQVPAGSVGHINAAVTLDGCPSDTCVDSALSSAPTPEPTLKCNPAPQNPNIPLLEQMFGRPVPYAPADGRPPGDGWAHQRFTEFPPEVYFQSAQTGARANTGLRNALQRHGYASGEFAPGGLYHNTVGAPGFDGTTAGIPAKMHPNFPVQDPRALWTFDGTFPVKLLQARYGEGVLFRHHNALPVDPAANFGFGTHTITTHLHNGHNPAESDGYMHAWFFPGQYYDFRWPMILAGYDTINIGATDPRAGRPDGNGGITRIRGDWRETQSSLWFHDHMLDFTSQNVYKGNAAVMNIYSAIDRGNEAINDGVNLRLPSGTALDWGNRDYDVNLVFGDKAWDTNGQLWFNPFQTDGFLGDAVTVNFQYAPYLDVRARRYRLRMLNGCVARYFKFALVRSTGEPVVFHLIGNDGNIMEHAVAFDGTNGTQLGVLPNQAIAERWDVIVDFAQFQPGERLYLVNLMEHLDGRGPQRTVPLADVLNGTYAPTMVDDNGDGVADRWSGGDPCVTKVMEFRVHAYSGTDLSMNPALYTPGGLKMVPLNRPTDAEIAAAKHHTFEFGRSGGTDIHPWTIKTDGGAGLTADHTLVSVAPQIGELQIWKFKSGGGWAHPVHVHFEEGITLSRGGNLPPVWERWARKDVWNIGGGPGITSEVEVALRFREFAGTYVEHCHNTTHEDTAMLLRWDLEIPGSIVPVPSPVPDWEGCVAVPSTSLPLARIGDQLGAVDTVANSVAWANAQTGGNPGGGATGGTGGATGGTGGATGGTGGATGGTGGTGGATGGTGGGTNAGGGTGGGTGGTGGGTTNPPTTGGPVSLVRSEYLPLRREWRIQGQLANTGAGVVVKVYLGGTPGGLLIGMAKTDSTGRFTLIKRNPPRGLNTKISFVTSNQLGLLNWTFTTL